LDGCFILSFLWWIITGSQSRRHPTKKCFCSAGSTVGITSVKIKSLDNYEELGYDENPITNVIVAARNPGSWANGIKVAIIDSKADQILSGIVTTLARVGYGVTQSLTGKADVGTGTSISLTGSYLKGIITEVGTSSIAVKILSKVSSGNTETIC
jgi:hypothetical protein